MKTLKEIFNLVANIELDNAGIFQNKTVCVIKIAAGLHSVKYKVLHKYGYCWDMARTVISYSDIDMTQPVDSVYTISPAWHPESNVTNNEIFDLIKNGL